MNCDELSQLLPDLVDGTLSGDLLAEAEAALAECPDCRRELEIAREIRTFLVALQAENANLQVPAGFESRLMARIHRQHNALQLVDISSQTFIMWLIELINLIGGLLDPASQFRASGSQATGA